jgi:RNA polymerase subunit RPABC4/transcription elongation factor Spt4
MPDIQIPGWLISILQLLIAFMAAFGLALWISLIIWTFRDVRSRSRDVFAILLATVMVVIFGPLGLIIYFLLRPPVTLAELYERSLEEEALLQDLEERPRCSGCSRVVEQHWIVCPDCHTQLKRICLNCNEKLNLRWNICPSCGTGVNQSAPLRPHRGPVRRDDGVTTHPPAQPQAAPAPTKQTAARQIFRKPEPPPQPAPQPSADTVTVAPNREADTSDMQPKTDPT